VDGVTSHAKANPMMQKDGRIDPSACPLTLYGANGHVTSSAPVQNDGSFGRRAQNWRTRSLNANEFLAMLGKRSFNRPEIIRGEETCWARGGADVWLVQIRAT